MQTSGIHSQISSKATKKTNSKIENNSVKKEEEELQLNENEVVALGRLNGTGKLKGNFALGLSIRKALMTKKPLLALKPLKDYFNNNQAPLPSLLLVKFSDVENSKQSVIETTKTFLAACIPALIEAIFKEEKLSEFKADTTEKQKELIFLGYLIAFAYNFKDKELVRSIPLLYWFLILIGAQESERNAQEQSNTEEMQFQKAQQQLFIHYLTQITDHTTIDIHAIGKDLEELAKKDPKAIENYISKKLPVPEFVSYLDKGAFLTGELEERKVIKQENK